MKTLSPTHLSLLYLVYFLSLGIAGPVYARWGGRALFAGAAVCELVPLIALLVLREEPAREKDRTVD